MRYERGAWASHFVFLSSSSSSSCSIAFLKGVKRCSEANAAKTPLPFLSKSQNESATHVRKCIHTSRRSACLSAMEGGGLMHRRAKVKAHTVLEAIKQWAFPSASSLRHFISSASPRDWRTDNFSRLHTDVLVCFWRSQCQHRETRRKCESVYLCSLKSSFSPSWKI